MVECPNRSLTNFGCTPASRASVAHVWRSECGPSILGLAGSVPAEGGDGRLVEADAALALGRLGRVEHELVVDGGEGLADTDEAGVEVHVLPAQAHRLSSTHPGRGDEHVAGVDRVVVDAGEELADGGRGVLGELAGLASVEVSAHGRFGGLAGAPRARGGVRTRTPS